MNRNDDARLALDSLRRIIRALRLADVEAERRLGISVAQLFVLRQLADGRPRSVRELADETLTDPSSVSVVVRRLVERGLLTRETDRADRRRAVLALTSEGRSLLSRAPEPPQDRLVQVLRDIPARRRHEFAATMRELADVLGVAEPTFFFEEE